MRVSLVIGALALTLTSVGIAITKPAVLGHSDTTESYGSVDVALFSKRLQLQTFGKLSEPLTYPTYGFSASTTQGNQKVEIDWQIICRKGTGEIERGKHGKLNTRTPVTFWKTTPLALSKTDTCNVSLSAQRGYESKGRLLLKVFGK